jgi:hypothetical protein
LNSRGDEADYLIGVFIMEFSTTPGCRDITEPKHLEALIYMPAITDTDDHFLASEAPFLIVD